jgi:hypothetical protein
MELFNFYSLDECLEQKSVKKKLNQLEEDGKIEYSLDGDILKIQDLDLDEEELSDLIKMFDANDIFPYPDYEEGFEDDDDFGYDDFDDEQQDY